MRENPAEYFLNVVIILISDSLMFPEDVSNKNWLGKFRHTQPNPNLDLIKLFSKIEVFKVSVLKFTFQQKYNLM